MGKFARAEAGAPKQALGLGAAGRAHASIYYGYGTSIKCVEQSTLPNLIPAEALSRVGAEMIRKLKSGEYRLYSRKKNESTGKRRNLGTFSTLEKAKQHEREVQYFKRH